MPEGYGGSSSSSDGLMSVPAEAFYVSKGYGKGNGKGGFGKFKPSKKGSGKGNKNNSFNGKRKLVQKLKNKASAAPNAAAGGLAKMQCWLCKGFGHSQRQCPNNRA